MLVASITRCAEMTAKKILKRMVFRSDRDVVVLNFSIDYGTARGPPVGLSQRWPLQYVRIGGVVNTIYSGWVDLKH